MPLPPPSGQLSVEGVIVAPPGSELPVLNGLTFSIPAGTTVAIIGPSGSGKSSLARTLVGIWTPRTGTVRYDGADLSTWNTTALGPFIGYLPQDIELFDGSVSENIARFGRIDPDKVIDAAIKAGLHESILRMPQGYETPVGPGGAALSGGQRQRIGLARALYGQVRLVVLDEPNSNLDDIGEAALVQAIQKLKAEGCTVVLITHRSSVLSTVDRVMVLREGVIQAYGPRDDVIAAIAQASQAARKNSSPPQGVLLGGSTSQKN
jgi:ABC-type protease/lipase transport system fused ATPase/permease subunit